MKVLVLGGNGFIGSHVVDALLATGHSVRVFDRTEDKYRGRLSDVEYVFGSFDDQLLLTEALSDVDVVFHGISTTVPSTSNAEPIVDIQTNLVSTVRLLQAMVNKGVHRIVYLSSGGTVYGNVDVDLIDETCPLHPVCSYGIVKIAIENYLFMYQELYGIKSVILRVSNPYGERQGHVGVQGVIGTLLNKIAKNEQIEIWGDGTVVRDFIYIGDLAQVCLKAIVQKVSGVYNIGGGIGHSINDVVASVKLVSSSSIEPIYKPARGFDVRRVVLDITLAQGAFSWQPMITLPQGMEKTWRWLNAH